MSELGWLTPLLVGLPGLPLNRTDFWYFQWQERQAQRRLIHQQLQHVLRHRPRAAAGCLALLRDERTV